MTDCPDCQGYGYTLPDELHCDCCDKEGCETCNGTGNAPDEDSETAS